MRRNSAASLNVPLTDRCLLVTSNMPSPLPPAALMLYTSLCFLGLFEACDSILQAKVDQKDCWAHVRRQDTATDCNVRKHNKDFGMSQLLETLCLFVVYLRSQLHFVMCQCLLTWLSLCDDLYPNVKQTLPHSLSHRYSCLSCIQTASVILTQLGKNNGISFNDCLQSNVRQLTLHQRQ